jgi:Cap4 dsDNA endonuclease
MTSVTTAQPPDDSGSDAFERYAYQAHVAFWFCLNCYFAGAPAAIYCEHFEDLLIEYVERLRFTQIKTRDAGRGPWRYTHLLEDGGALRSLARTHQALASLNESRPIEYDIRLEGAIASGEKEIQCLLVGGDGADEEMCKRCSERLGIDEAAATALLALVTVRPDQPPRELIAARNRDLLRLRAGHLPAAEIATIYDEAIDLIKRAMEAGLLADAWPQAILEPDDGEGAAAQRAAAKRLDHDRLEPIFSRLEGGLQPLLALVTDPDRLRATALEVKLDGAGATPGLIDRAKQLRAQAANTHC